MVKAKANKLIFADAEKARNAITKDQQKQITKLYEQWAEEIGKTADRFAKKSNPSSALSEIYMRELQKQLVATRENLIKQVESTIKSGMQQIADNVIASNVKWLQGLGFPKSGLNAAFSYVPSDIVERLTTGKVYQSGWSLSKAIWSDSEKTMAEAYKVVAGGLAKQQSIYEIAKDLEKFINPKAKKDWNLTDKDGRRIYPRKVDYAAQRLARTLAQHSYQQTFQETTKDNPLITKYRWNANGSRACEICKERDGKVYDKDKLPMDHPNGMCVMEPVTVSDEEMTKQLVDWVNGEDGDFPEIDRFAKRFGYTPSIKKNVKQKVKPVEPTKPKPNSVVPKKPVADSKLFEEVRQSLPDNMIKHFKLTEAQSEDFISTVTVANEKYKGAFLSVLNSVKWKKLPKDQTSQSAYYKPSNKSIYIDAQAQYAKGVRYKFDNKLITVFHELGHAVDFNAAYKGQASGQKGKGFLKAIENDLKNIADIVSSPRRSQEKQELLKALKDDNSHGIQDGLSGAVCLDTKWGQDIKEIYRHCRWSHSEDYWRRDDTLKEVSSEMFAHIFASKFSKVEQEYMEKYFPNASAQADNIIEAYFKKLESKSKGK